MFPYRDDNPTLATPIVTLLIIGANVLAWVVVQGMGSEPLLSRSVCELGLIPGELLGRLPEGYTLPMSRTTVCVITGEPRSEERRVGKECRSGWSRSLHKDTFVDVDAA